MSLKSYCEENARLHILEEWDTEKNLPLTPESVAHTSSTPVWWRCEKDTPGARRSGAVPEAPPAAPNAGRRSWKRKDSGRWKRHAKVI